MWKPVHSREVTPNLAGPIEQAAEGHVVPGVYLDLRAFVLAHANAWGDGEPM